jgi:hypothetical protein
MEAPKKDVEKTEEGSEEKHFPLDPNLMEVHHHTHKEISTGHKKTKHYLFEFFMLFLAVFAGSVAEYFLEHVVEQKREKQYIESMIEDLRIDTFSLKRVIDNNKEQKNGLDSLLDILDRPSVIFQSETVRKRLYFLNNNYTSALSTMDFSRRTISQLKNSGNMRLIHNVLISDSMMDYDQNINLIELQGKALSEFITDLIKSSSSIFDGRNLRRYKFHSPKTQPSFGLLTSDSLKLLQYGNMVSVNRGVINGYIQMLQYQEDRAINLISFLNKEYKLNKK